MKPHDKILLVDELTHRQVKKKAAEMGVSMKDFLRVKMLKGEKTREEQKDLIRRKDFGFF